MRKPVILNIDLVCPPIFRFVMASFLGLVVSYVLVVDDVYVGCLPSFGVFYVFVEVLPKRLRTFVVGCHIHVVSVKWFITCLNLLNCFVSCLRVGSMV